MKRERGKLFLISALLLGVIVIALARVVEQPRVLAVDEVPIAYWAWRTNAPGPIDVEKAFALTDGKTLFIRAGQIDFDQKKFKRIRPLEGRMPSRVELHLVYNATPELLRELDAIDIDALAKIIGETYKADLVRSRDQMAEVFGLQLDLDFPTRLLPKYETLLRKLRPLLPRDTKLSITGLPAWMASPDLTAVLELVDFWIPQFYGGEIPTHITRHVPISSAADVARNVGLARRLGKPFYAGIAAYSYAIAYGTNGNLIEVRANIDPADVERNSDLEQTDRRSFSNNEPSAMRYEYRAKNDLVLDGLVIRSGQTVVLDVPSSALLRASAMAVRENGGENLLGICLFRLPISTDDAVLTTAEANAALADTETKVLTSIRLLKLDDGRLYLESSNEGSASTMLGEEAFAVDIELPPGVGAVLDTSKGFDGYKTLCRVGPTRSVEPCSPQRANVLRLQSRSWRAGDGGSATIEFVGMVPSQLSIHTTFHVDDGRTQTEYFELPIQNNEPGTTNQ